MVLRLRFLQGMDMEVEELPAFPILCYLEIHNCNDCELNYHWSRYAA